MIVHQVLAGAGPHDAVTAQALAYRARFSAWGWGGSDFATFIAPGASREIKTRRGLAPGPDDVLLLHHSAVAPELDALLAMPNRKVLVYHNITPAIWLWDVAPVLAAYCAVGREQLPVLAKRVDACIAVSEFNARELTEAGGDRVEVVPLLTRLDRLGAVGPRVRNPEGPTVLFVGRLSPHKRQDEVIRAFALYLRHRAPGARLELVGEAVTPPYGDHLRALAEELVPGAVRFADGLSDLELGERYRAADALLCLSEHEGFCLPLIEALRFGVPVVARAAGAVPETLGGAGLMVEAGDDLAVVAELLQLAVSDGGLRAELARRAPARLAAYDPEDAAGRLRGVLESVYSGL